jgi:UDP-N-acetylmuramoylalanine--D-glutamate ligase
MIGIQENGCNREALVLGLGRSGAAAARLLAAQGWRVTVTDRGTGTVAVPEGVRFLANAVDLPSGDFDLCVVSPGIDCQSAWVQQAATRCREVISELELGWRHCRCPIVAVTGTNGKSTLVKLLSDLLTAGGMRSEPSGNYGIPLCESAARSDALDWIVAEVSSFQLELVRDFRPRIGIMLNLQPDHLGRHGSMEHYAALKARLFRAMREGDTALVYEADFAAMREAAGACNPAWTKFGTGDDCAARYAAALHAVRYLPPEGGSEVRVSLLDTGFDNPVTGPAAAAAVAAATRCGLDADTIQAGIAGFVPLAHRMQPVATVAGVRYVNDSKATNLTALRAALEMTSAQVRLIAGGQLKEKDLDFIKEILKKCVRSVYLIGEAAREFAAAWQDCVPCRLCGDLKTAVLEASREAQSGDVVLLSPGCASFDQFRSYADRGDQFRNFVCCMVNQEERGGEK